MRFFPHRQFEIESFKPASELADRLARDVEPVVWFRLLWSDHKNFQGEFDGRRFRLHRIAYGARGWLIELRCVPKTPTKI